MDFTNGVFQQRNAELKRKWSDDEEESLPSSSSLMSSGSSVVFVPNDGFTRTFSASSPTRKLTLDEFRIPTKPKRPMTPFFRFTNEYVRPNVLKEHPSLAVTQITKIASEKWKAADEDLKKQLSQDFQEQMKVYRKAMESYTQELLQVDRTLLLDLNMDTRTKKEKKVMKKRRAEFGCPKKPLTPYFLYLRKRRAELNLASNSNRELVSQVAAEWKSLGESEKKIYLEMQKKNKEEYLEQMARWEREMKQSGNSHLISPKKSSSRSSKR